MRNAPNISSRGQDIATLSADTILAQDSEALQGGGDGSPVCHVVLFIELSDDLISGEAALCGSACVHCTELFQELLTGFAALAIDVSRPTTPSKPFIGLHFPSEGGRQEALPSVARSPVGGDSHHHRDVLTLTKGLDPLARSLGVHAMSQAKHVPLVMIQESQSLDPAPSIPKGFVCKWCKSRPCVCPPLETAVQDNRRVRACSMHGTSVHLGLAADSVAQADYDMAASVISGQHADHRAWFESCVWHDTSKPLKDLLFWSTVVAESWNRPVDMVPTDVLMVGELMAHGVFVSVCASDELIEALYAEVCAPHLATESPLASAESEAYLKQGRTPLRGGGGKARVRDHAEQSWTTRRADPNVQGGNTMTTRAEVVAFLEKNPVTHLVVFEFSGAVTTRLARAHVVMSVDKRAAEHQGAHYQGDVRDIIDLCWWEAIYFLGPNCFQHLRRDPTLWAKKLDGRAFWGGAMVIWCLCCPYTSALILEQPDTIVFDYIDVTALGFEVVEFRTGQLDGGSPDKLIRLVALNFELLPPELKTRRGGPAAPTPRRPSMWEYPHADGRDRARSTWANKPHTSQYVADLRVKADVARVVPVDYETAIHLFSERWVADGNYLPDDFDNPTGQPLSEEARAHQEVRGEGGAKRNTTRDGKSTQTVDGPQGVATSMPDAPVQRGRPGRTLTPTVTPLLTPPPPHTKRKPHLRFIRTLWQPGFLFRVPCQQRARAAGIPTT